jgi:ABC-type glycerol-3-phosphate transport system substrate-binding protein
MKRKKFISIICVVNILLWLFISCKPKSSTSASDAGEALGGTFTYWSCYSGDSAEWEQWRVDQYNEKFKDQGIFCELQFVPDRAGIANGKLLSAISSGTAPDLIVCDYAPDAYSYAANGAFEPLDNLVGAAGIEVNGFFPGAADVMYYKNTLYLIPQDSNVFLFYYNVDLVKAAGLDPENPPKTIAELDSWAEKLTITAPDGSYNQLGFIPWQDHAGSEAWTMPFFFGVDVYNSETNKLDITSPQMINYLTWIRGYARKYGIEKMLAVTSNAGGRSTPDHPFYTGKVAMTVTLNSFTNLIRNYGPKDLNYKVTAVPAPADGRANSTTFTTNVFAVPRGSKKAALALHFIKFALSAEISEDNYATWRSIPVIDAEFENVSWTKKGDPIYALERQLANSPESGVPALCSVASELGDAFKALRDSVMHTNIDIPSALKELQEKYQKELDAQ